MEGLKASERSMKYKLHSFLVLLFTVVVSISGCGKELGDGAPDVGPPPEPESLDLLDLSPYRSGTLYGEAITECIDINSLEESCQLARLPLIGQETNNPTVDDILGRTVVSHEWMGDRFKQVLESAPADMLLLFRSVTAIVIDTDIRPAFYHTFTGAIYLDPAYLWMTLEEKATISKKEDYRSGYGNNLSFDFFWRYVKNDDYAWVGYDLDDAKERTSLAHMTLPAFRLLYHELAHANDFAPVDQIPFFLAEDTIVQAINKIEDQWLSNRLYPDHALNSQELIDLAQVRFDGVDPTEAQRAYTPDYVGSLFHNDGSNSFYNYVDSHEDLSMLFEATMMKFNFDIEKDMAVGLAEEGAQWCNELQIAWAERNRIAHELVAPRAKAVANMILPDLEWDGYFLNGVGSSTPKEVSDWCVDNWAASLPTRSIREFNREVPESDLRAPH